jgi:predicted ATP-grasp superfamily ATP-dependent carboligase
MQWVYDKRLTYQLASDLGVNHPKTYYPQNREEVGALHCDFPVILKPAFKQFLNSFTRARAWLARDPDELLRRYDEAVALTDPKIVMIQEFIAGGNENQFSYAALHWAGRSIASLVARRTRQYPLDFSQGSSYVETIECGEIEVSSKRLLGAIKYDGIVEVEFKRDNRDKTYKLLDVNARVWGWHTLGFRSGLDFSYLLFQCMQGQPVQEIHAAKGLKWIRFVRDVPAAYGQYRKGALSFRTYLRSLIDASEFAVLAKDDPLPALLEIPFLLASRFYRFRRLQTVQRFYY